MTIFVVDVMAEAATAAREWKDRGELAICDDTKQSRGSLAFTSPFTFSYRPLFLLATAPIGSEGTDGSSSGP